MADFENTQKARTGLDRILRAAVISYQGFTAALREKAFRQEVAISCVLFPASFFVGKTWLEVLVLNALVAQVLMAEIFNSAIEAVVDRIGPERHPLSGAAKDMGSAGVAICLLICGGGWAYALYRLFIGAT